MNNKLFTIVEKDPPKDYNINNNNTRIKTKNIDILMSLINKDFFNELDYSFKTLDDIKHQCSIDIPRSKVFLNNKRIYGFDKLDRKLKRLPPDFKKYIYMLTTQAPLAKPYMIIKSQINPKFELLDLSNLNEENPLKIKIDSLQYVYIKKKLFIYDINNDKIKGCANIKLKVPLDIEQFAQLEINYRKKS